MDYTGQSKADFLGYGWKETIHPEDLELLHKRWKQATETGERYETECRIRAADGEYRWFSVIAVATYSEDGQLTVGLGLILTSTIKREIKSEWYF